VFYLDCIKTGHGGPVGPRLSSRGDAAELAVKAGRFHAVKTDNIAQLDSGKPSPYFWVAWTDSSWQDKLTPPQMLEQRGCHSGAQISQHDNFHAVMMTPITCP
jgi:hypothetical protein